MAKNEKQARLFDKCQIFLVGKLLNVKLYNRLENGIFLIMVLPPVQQTFNSLSFKKKLLHRWCNSPDFVQPICRLVGLWHLRDGCHNVQYYHGNGIFDIPSLQRFFPTILLHSSQHRMKNRFMEFTRHCFVFFLIEEAKV